MCQRWWELGPETGTSSQYEPYPGGILNQAPNPAAQREPREMFIEALGYQAIGRHDDGHNDSRVLMPHVDNLVR